MGCIMRTLIVVITVLAGALGLVASATDAAQDRAGKPRGATVELVVFEHTNCTYCQVFRSDVAPRYAVGTQAERAPLRYINIEQAGTDGMGLNGSIHMVPTFVLMKDGREVDRIVGYWSPDNFFKMVAYMLMKAE